MAKFSFRNQVKEPIKTKLREKDQVIVIAGKNKGSQGEIMSIDKVKGRVLVKGINMRKISVRKMPNRDESSPQHGLVEMEFPIHISNVMLYDPKEKKGTRVGFKTKEEKGKTVKIRVSKKSDKEI